MRFAREPLAGTVPYAYDVAWNQVREPDANTQQALALVAGATLCIATFVAWLVLAPFKPMHIGYATLAIAAIIVMFLHELSHAMAFTMKRSDDLRVACAWRKWRLSVRYEGAVTRNHYVLVLVAPLVALSAVPVVVSWVASAHSGDIALVSIINALVSGGDFIAGMLVLAQVPAGALMRRQGDVVLWKARSSA